MNPIYKFYCRAFQTGFKLALPLLPYHFPEIQNDIKYIPTLLKEHGVSKVLILTDSSLSKLGLLEPLRSILAENDIEFYIFDEVLPNPTVKLVEQAREIYIRSGCNGLIGFGGGSSIDCAKAVGARYVRKRTPIQKMAGILKVHHKIPYLIAIPTTAGTGSETTVTTVITDSENEHKFPISDFCLIPKAAVLDAEMTRTLPPSMTATTGMDALTHAIEAFIGRTTTKETRSQALTASKLISENIITAYTDGNNIEARSNMLKAAYLAGCAFTQSYVGYCHSVAHSLGGKYNIPHGLANTVLLPYVLESYGSSIYKKAKKLAIAMGIADSNTEPCVATKNLIEWIRETNRKMNIPDKLKGIKAEDIPQLARYAAKEGNPIYPVPVLMNAKELEQFYYNVMEDEK